MINESVIELTFFDFFYRTSAKNNPTQTTKAEENISQGIKILEDKFDSLTARIFSFQNEQIYETVNIANRNKLKVHTFNMIGVPFETRKSIWKTIRMNRKIRPERVQCTMFFAYPHTKIDYINTLYAEGNNVTFNKSTKNYTCDTIKSHHNFFIYELKLYVRMFKFLVYLGYSIKKAIKEVI